MVLAFLVCSVFSVYMLVCGGVPVHACSGRSPIWLPRFVRFTRRPSSPSMTHFERDAPYVLMLFVIGLERCSRFLGINVSDREPASWFRV